MSRPDEPEMLYEPYRDGEQPAYYFERYPSTTLRSPKRPLFTAPRTISETTGPVFSQESVRPGENDLAHGPDGRRAAGQLIIVAGRVTDEDGRAVPDTLIEIWQTNAAGRYNHPSDRSDAPLDPGFTGCGRCVTDADGRYSFTTIKPAPYPVQGSGNWWRPPHIHFSLFGPTFLSRVITQIYFSGDPLNDLDPILASVTDPAARARLVATLDPGIGIFERALGYRFDIVLRGRRATPAVG